MFEIPDVTSRERGAVDADDCCDHGVKLSQSDARRLFGSRRYSRELAGGLRVKGENPALEILHEEPFSSMGQPVFPPSRSHDFDPIENFRLRNDRDENAPRILRAQPAQHRFRRFRLQCFRYRVGVQNDHLKSGGSRMGSRGGSFNSTPPKRREATTDRLREIQRPFRFILERGAEEFARLRFHRSAVLGRSDAETSFDCFVQTPDRDAGHTSMIALQSLISRHRLTLATPRTGKRRTWATAWGLDGHARKLQVVFRRSASRTSGLLRNDRRARASGDSRQTAPSIR